MKIALLTIFTASLVLADEPITPKKLDDLIPKAIPKHVRYTKPTVEHARKARATLVKEFTSDDPTNLNNSKILVCHKIWDSIIRLKLISPEKGMNFTRIDPDGTKLQGRGYRDEPEIKTAWKFLRDRLHSKGETKVRTPTEQEISTYWSMIGWDIKDSPLFVVEHGDNLILFTFTKEEVFQAIDLSKLKQKKRTPKIASELASELSCRGSGDIS